MLSLSQRPCIFSTDRQGEEARESGREEVARPRVVVVFRLLSIPLSRHFFEVFRTVQELLLPFPIFLEYC